MKVNYVIPKKKKSSKTHLNKLGAITTANVEGFILVSVVKRKGASNFFFCYFKKKSCEN